MDKGFSGDSGTKLVRAPRLPPLTCANGNPQSSENRQAGSRSDIREENERGIDCRKKRIDRRIVLKAGATRGGRPSDTARRTCRGQRRCWLMSAPSRRRSARGMVAASKSTGWTRPPALGPRNRCGHDAQRILHGSDNHWSLHFRCGRLSRGGTKPRHDHSTAWRWDAARRRIGHGRRGPLAHRGGDSADNIELPRLCSDKLPCAKLCSQRLAVKNIGARGFAVNASYGAVGRQTRL